jgi:hypothetical protein
MAEIQITETDAAQPGWQMCWHFAMSKRWKSLCWEINRIAIGNSNLKPKRDDWLLRITYSNGRLVTRAFLQHHVRGEAEQTLPCLPATLELLYSSCGSVDGQKC